MIFVRDKGQMCNNIFQYIQMYAWGREHGRKTMSMRFAYKYPYFAIRHFPYEHPFFYLLGKSLAYLHLIPIVDFNECSSLEDGLEVVSQSRHCMVQGWRLIRLPELVDKYMGEIRMLFAFKDSVQKNVLNRMSGKADIQIGIHVRRGDYKTFLNGRFYFTDDEYISYINRVLSLLPKDKSHCVYICTNDGKLNRERYAADIRGGVVFSDGTGEEDLCLLSACDYIVGPTSSFSLIATMYGKAKLYWMSHLKDSKDVALEGFGDFDTMSRHFDEAFVC